MSRYRDDRDDYYGARRDDVGRTRERGYYGGRGAEPFDSAYGGGDRGPDARREEQHPPRDYGDDRPREYGDARGYDEARSYRDRDYYGNDYPTGRVGRRGESADYERAGRRPEEGRGYADDREGRSLWEEGREYFARRGYRRGRTSRSHVRCRDIMTRDVTVATRATTLDEVARMMRDEDTGVIPVVERGTTPIHTGTSTSAAAANASNDAASPVASVAPVLPVSTAPVGESPEARRINADIHGNGRLVGLITDRDIAVRAVAEGRDVREVRAEEIMTADVHTAHPNDRVIDAIRKMGDKQVRRIPIVDRDGTLRGIISMADVALETNDDRELAEALEEISSGQGFWNRVFG
ncbi:MAG: CBS domain-containing protein [Pyrinomonadaceae bacterium]